MDKQWRKAFIDRTLEQNANEPMNKLIKLNSLSMYWNQQEENMLKTESSQDNTNFIYQMRSLIFQKNAQIVTKQDQEIYQKLLKSQIFNLNSEARLIQNKKENFTEALNILQLELENINITLEHLQLQQAIQILDKFMSYNKMLYMHRKNAIEIDQQTEQFFQIKFIESYQQIYQQLQENPNKQNPLDILDQDLRP